MRRIIITGLRIKDSITVGRVDKAALILREDLGSMS